jgi:hypothetical protein
LFGAFLPTDRLIEKCIIRSGGKKKENEEKSGKIKAKSPE